MTIHSEFTNTPIDPYPVADLIDYLPHRPPMIWLNDIIGVNPEGGVARVIYDHRAHYCDERGRVRDSSYFEWIAQCFGYAQAYAMKKGIIPTLEDPLLTFFAQITQGQIEKPAIQTREYFVSAQLKKKLGNLHLIEGVVEDDQGNTIAKAQVKIFTMRVVST